MFQNIIKYTKANKNIILLISIFILVTLFSSTTGFFRLGNNNFFISKMKQRNTINSCVTYKNQANSYIKGTFGSGSKLIDIFYSSSNKTCLVTFKNIIQEKIFYYILDLDSGNILDFVSPEITTDDGKVSQDLFNKIQQKNNI